MKLKNYFLFVIIMFVFTGCSAEYNLNIDRNLDLSENMIITANGNSEALDKIRDFDQYIPIDYTADDYGVFVEKVEDVEYYDIVKDTEVGCLSFSYDKYDIDTINYSRIALSCFENVSFMNLEEETLMISTSDEFLCFDNYNNLDDVKVVLTSKYKLIDTNADEVDNYNYIWYFDRGDYNKNIYLELDLTNEDLTLFDIIFSNPYYTIMFVIGLVFIIGFIGYKLLRIYSNSKNKI